LEVLFLALQPFTYNCSIARTCNPGPGSYLYKINLNDNLAPVLMVENQISSVKEEIRYLDIENFLSEITAWLDKNKDNDNSLLIEQELELFPAVVTRLKVNLNEVKSRSENHAPQPLSSECLKLIIGLVPLESLLIMKSADLDLKLNYQLSEWTLQSESPAGCELISHIGGIEDELSLGDLVAIVSDSNDNKSISLVNIAHICAVQQLQHGVLHLALEYLAGSANPLTYMMISESGEAKDSTRSNGIYLLDESGNHENSLMMVNRKHYQESQHYLVTTREKLCTVMALELVMQTLRYSFFHYKVLQEECKDTSAAINLITLAS
jgi:hypothetical protein